MFCKLYFCGMINHNKGSKGGRNLPAIQEEPEMRLSVLLQTGEKLELCAGLKALGNCYLSLLILWRN